MRKKIISIIIISVLFISSSYGQISFGVKGGVNVSQVYFDDKTLDKSNITGFQVGPVIEGMFGVMGFDAGVLFSQRGLELKEDGGNLETRTNYLDVPVNLKFKAGTPLLKFFLYGGPYISFLVSGDESINSNIDAIRESWKAKSFQGGVNAGAGLEFLSTVQIGFNYSWGLTDDFSNSDFGSKDRTWSVTAACFF